MNYDELIQHKLKLHHLHRDYNIQKDTEHDTSKLNRLYRIMTRIDMLLKKVYREMESRKTRP
jgi:hypothetical protein